MGILLLSGCKSWPTSKIVTAQGQPAAANSQCHLSGGSLIEAVEFPS